MQLELILPTQTKQCKKCKEIKPLTEFSRDNGRKDGLFLWCKECSRKSATDAWKANPNVRLAHREAVKRFKARESGKIAPFRPSSRYELPRQKESNLSKKARVRLSSRVFCAEIKNHFSCQLCGESFPQCLDFHHINDEQKLFAVSDAISKRKSVQTIVSELTKCACLCANCHRKLHAGAVDLSSVRPITLVYLSEIVSTIEQQNTDR